MVDLGAWLLGHYRVPDEPGPDDDSGPPIPKDLRLPPDDDDPAA
jgi:endogenous inhibitor of DNA gyrase (YacG/DUF329 family)